MRPLSAYIPKFTTKDYPIMVGSMLPLTLLLNSIIFERRYFSDWGVFLPATLILFALLALAFLSFGFVAVLLRNRLPYDHQTNKRLSLCLVLFVGMSAVIIAILLRTYEYSGFLGYTFDERHFKKGFIALVVTNVFLTFLNEGIAKFENYRAVVSETAQLKRAYLQSQLLGLKSQMNPHFLFNSLNTLSCLIHENEEEAEEFLDHMCKVYRYLLRTNEEQLVPLATELNFISSYFYLLKARHSEGLELHTEVDAQAMEMSIPPLTLQVVVENAINQNSISREQPLRLHIFSTPGQWLGVRNSIQKKIGAAEETDEALVNMSDKFRLLCQKDVVFELNDTERQILIPLIPSKEMSPA